MNILKPIAMSTAILVAGAANASDANNETIIDKPVFNSHDGVFSIEALQALGRVSSPVLSPDKKRFCMASLMKVLRKTVAITTSML